MSNSILALILAAGEGKRMQSRQAKVMQKVGGKPMIAHILNTLGELEQATPAVIYGHRGDNLREGIVIDYPDIAWVKQEEQLGTGHAVQQASHLFKDDHIVLVLLGDVPLIRASTIEKLCAQAEQTGLAVLTTQLENPFGYGRIVRDPAGQVVRIVEERDASELEREIKEVNSGIMAFTTDTLRRYLNQLQNNNAQGEYYLTDLIEICSSAGIAVIGECVEDSDEVMGVNNRRQQAEAERVYRARCAESLLDAGVTLLDPQRIDVHGSLHAGKDVLLGANVTIKGDVVLGDGVVIESGCVLENCTIGDNCIVRSYSCIEASCQVGRDAIIGPYARLRPNTVLDDGARIGNFVETKNAQIGQGSKVNHLSYIGDATVGSGVNIGAGTITCNYDGANKFQTNIEDNVFIGSNSALVAPITIGARATVGAGSILSTDVAQDSLTFNRAPLKVIKEWIRPKKKA